MVIFKKNRKIWCVALAFTKQTVLSARFIALMLFTSVYIINILLPLRMLASDYQQPVSYAVFAFVLENPITRIVIFSSLFLIFANLPIRGHYALVMIQRTGKRVWMLSQTLYVVLMSTIYTMTLFIVLLVVLSPYNLFENRWGRLLYTLTNKTSTDFSQINLAINKISLDYFSPDEAIAHIMLVMLLLCIFFGLGAIVFNYLHDNLGTVISFITIFFAIVYL